MDAFMREPKPNQDLVELYHGSYVYEPYDVRKCMLYRELEHPRVIETRSVTL